MNSLDQLARQLVTEGYREDDPGPGAGPIQERSGIDWRNLVDAVGRTLARDYLATYPHPPRAVLDAMALDGPGSVFRVDSDTERHLREEIWPKIAAGRDVAEQLFQAQDPNAEIDKRFADVLGADLVAAIRDRAREMLKAKTWHGLKFAWAWDAGGALETLIFEYSTLLQNESVSRAERGVARMRLIGASPPVLNYLEDRGWLSGMDGFRAELLRLVEDDPPRTLDGAKIVAVDGLRDLYPLPRALFDAFAPAEYWKKKDPQIEILPVDLETWEYRTLMALGQIDATPFDDGDTRSGIREVPWATYCAAVGIRNRREGNEIRRAVDALFLLKTRQILVKIDRGNGTVSAKVVSILDGLHGLELVFDSDDGPRVDTLASGWTGRAPLLIRFQLSDPLRRADTPFLVSGASVRGLREAAKAVRGKQSRLDFGLWFALHRLRQKNGLSYVDRDQLMRQHLGAKVFDKYISRRQYAKGILGPYLAAVRVLEKNETIDPPELDVQTTKGTRDLFRLRTATRR